MKKRFTEEQIIAALKRMDAGLAPKELAREMGVHQQTLYDWRKKFGGMEVSDAKKLRSLEAENTKLKRIVATLAMEVDDLRFINSKNW